MFFLKTKKVEKKKQIHAWAFLFHHPFTPNFLNEFTIITTVFFPNKKHSKKQKKQPKI